MRRPLAHATSGFTGAIHDPVLALQESNIFCVIHFFTLYGSLVSSYGTMVFVAHVSGESIRSGPVAILWNVPNIDSPGAPFITMLLLEDHHGAQVAC
jgi:hypothetical protein